LTLNVPIDERTGRHYRMTAVLKATLPTINYLIQNQARIILCSHLGRPHGQPAKSLSLAPVADRLSKILRQPVYFAHDCIGPDVELMVNHLNPGEIILLENLRFHIEEEKNVLHLPKHWQDWLMSMLMMLLAHRTAFMLR